jgi:hypothetical protein
MKDLRMYIVTILAVPFFSSCEQEATNVDLPETTPKLVVGCFIDPDEDTLVATVSESNPIFGVNHNNVGSLTLPEAVVKITDGVNSATLAYDNLDQKFKISAAQFPINAGKTYYIDVSAPDVKSLPVSSSCTIPADKVNSANATIEPGGSEGQILETTWTDLPGASFYRVFVEYVMTLNGDTAYYAGNNSIYDDQGNNGGLMTSRIDVFYPIGSDYVDWAGTGETYKVIGYHIIIANVDANYYKYFRSLQNYTYNDPFAEPSPVYTNIKDGLGIFSGFNSYSFMKF